MNSKGLTGFANGYHASNLASVEQQLDIALPRLKSKLEALRDEAVASGDVGVLKSLTNLLAIVQMESSTPGRLREFSSTFFEYVATSKAARLGTASPKTTELQIVIAKEIISLAEKSEDDNVLSTAIRLGNLLKTTA